MNDPIKHVIVLMLENNSFDRMLGDFQAVYPNLDGVSRRVPVGTNNDAAGQVYSQSPTHARVVFPDPRHETSHVLDQIEVPPPKPWELSDQPTWITDPLGAITAYVYDGLGRTTSVKLPDPRATRRAQRALHRFKGRDHAATHRRGARRAGYDLSMGRPSMALEWPAFSVALNAQQTKGR